MRLFRAAGNMFDPWLMLKDLLTLTGNCTLHYCTLQMVYCRVRGGVASVTPSNYSQFGRDGKFGSQLNLPSLTLFMAFVGRVGSTAIGSGLLGYFKTITEVVDKCTTTTSRVYSPLGGS